MSDPGVSDGEAAATLALEFAIASNDVNQWTDNYVHMYPYSTRYTWTVVVDCAFFLFSLTVLREILVDV